MPGRDQGASLTATVDPAEKGGYISHPRTPLTENPARFHPEDWARLTEYSHTHKQLAFEFYTKRYVATSGQVYYHDWQLSAAYQPDYHMELDRKMHAKVKATEMITEIYVPRSALVDFMEEARLVLREQKANVIYTAPSG